MSHNCNFSSRKIQTQPLNPRSRRSVLVLVGNIYHNQPSSMTAVLYLNVQIIQKDNIHMQNKAINMSIPNDFVSYV